MNRLQQAYGVSALESGISHELPEGAELRKIFIDTKNPIDTAFANYGHLFYKALVENGRGQWTSNSGIKYWEQDGHYRKILPINCPVYPFEALEEDLTNVLENDLKDSRFKIVDKNFTHNGFTGYWTLLSDDIRQVIKGSYVKDDVVQVGLVIRNGIATGVSLGADVYTYRLWCTNGAVGRGENFGSISIRHVGDRKKMIDTFKAGIPLVVNVGQKILEYYEMATAFRFDEAMAKKIFKKTSIAEKYFPQYYHIDRDQKDPNKVVSLTHEGTQISLWEAFNDLTANLTKSFDLDPTHITRNGQEVKTAKLGFSGFSTNTRELHRCLISIIDKRRNDYSSAASA